MQTEATVFYVDTVVSVKVSGDNLEIELVTQGGKRIIVSIPRSEVKTLSSMVKAIS